MGGLWFWLFLIGCYGLVLWHRHLTKPEQPDKLVVDLSTVEAGQTIDLPPEARIKHVEFINPLDEQDYVLKKYVFARSAAEAIGLDAQTPVAEVFIADEKVKFEGQTQAVGFHNVHPEEE